MPVRTFPRRLLFNLLIVMLTLTACNVEATPAPTIDINVINTAAYNTAMAQISAQQTMTALAAPTNTQFPTNAPVSLATVGLSTTGATSGALPTVSFNGTANITPLAGFTPLVTSVAPTTSGIGNTA